MPWVRFEPGVGKVVESEKEVFERGNRKNLFTWIFDTGNSDLSNICRERTTEQTFKQAQAKGESEPVDVATDKG